jgi:hypothetical protein
LSFYTPQINPFLEILDCKALSGAKLGLPSESFGDDESLIAHMLTIALRIDTKTLMTLQLRMMRTTMKRTKMPILRKMTARLILKVCASYAGFIDSLINYPCLSPERLSKLPQLEKIELC